MTITILPVAHIPEVKQGDDIAALIAKVAQLHDGDVVVVTQKIVSKAEGRIVAVSPDDDEGRHRIVESEAKAILRKRNGLIITETEHGFICANAGVDNSNVAMGSVTLLPKDPDLSARRIRARLRQLVGVDVAVIVSDTFGRAWRIGQTNVAIGVAGMLPVIDYRGTTDQFGQVLKVTLIAIADELASAAELVMGKADGIPAAIVRGAKFTRGSGTAADLVRPPQDDLFR